MKEAGGVSWTLDTIVLVGPQMMNTGFPGPHRATAKLIGKDRQCPSVSCPVHRHGVRGGVQVSALV